jgi:hypothetical protein
MKIQPLMSLPYIANCNMMAHNFIIRQTMRDNTADCQLPP